MSRREKRMKSAEIDFIILWVDSGDPEWRREFKQYAEGYETGEGEYRFREWDTLQYLFRAFELFTPWVRKIHLVTWGHVPDWLNDAHPKLHIVEHTHYIETSFLPLFNANPLEINLHRIPGLSEKFVYFNDDTFLTAPLKEERFFSDGKPRDLLVSNALSSSSGVGHLVLNDLEILNRHFSKRRSIQHHLGKWFNYRYGVDSLRNLALLPWPRFTGFIDPHQPQPFLRSTYKEVWKREGEVLKKTMTSRFRRCSDVNQYLFRYWQLASGNFKPVSMKDTKYITLSMKNLRSGEVEKAIRSREYSMICLNDNEAIDTEEEFEEAKSRVQSALDSILPHKSGFEK